MDFDFSVLGTAGYVPTMPCLDGVIHFNGKVYKFKAFLGSLAFPSFSPLFLYVPRTLDPLFRRWIYRWWI